MKRGKKLIRFFLRFLSIAIFVLLATGEAKAQDPPPEEARLSNGFRVTFEEVDYERDGTSTWRYRVVETFSFFELDYWVLALPPCIDVIDASSRRWEEVHPDRATQLSGIRWSIRRRFRAGDFSVTIAGHPNPGTTRVAARSGPFTGYGEIAGPTCTENRAPVAEEDRVTVRHGNEQVIAVLNNDSDPDGDELHLEDFERYSNSGGKVERLEMDTPHDRRDDRLLYTPPSGFSGEDRFHYSVSDGIQTVSGVVVVIVEPAAPPPIANPDSYSVEGTDISVPAPGVLENDSLPDGVTGRAVLLDEPEHGDLTLAEDGSFQYLPEEGFVGADEFAYQIEADTGVSDPAEVFLQVPDLTPPTVVWLSPAAEGERYDVQEGQRVHLEVEITDNQEVEQAEFILWDAVNEEYRTLDGQRRAPYETKVDASILNSGWNQVFVVVHDIAGNRAPDSYIWLYKITPTGGAGGSLFLPLISQGR